MTVNSEIKILVLDDELLMLKLHAQILASLGFTSVTTCQKGGDALAAMDGDGAMPDVILLDLSMPGMDGVEFMRHLVDRAFQGRLILCSGEDERVLRSVERLAQAHHVRVLGHVAKPAQQEDLATLLRRWRPASGTGEIAWRKFYTADEVKAGIDGDQLTVFYEPKVDVKTGALVGVEALVRWKHPKDGMVLPEQFISIAEASGQIQKVTRFVFTAAMAQVARWRKAGLSLRIAINASVDALSSLDFANFASDQAALANVATKDVVIEVTESRLMQDLRAPLEVLTRLHLMRFQLSIDDFGTGYSSLTQLRDIPFSELKIDRSFVHRATQDQTVRTMYRTCLGLAKQLSMGTVAEGVEDKSDWDFVRDSECETAQGYFIARPMAPEGLMAWSDRWAERVKLGFPAED
ncbi:MAG: EAL domain-containing response regulator [Vicinamibacteria bacterium]